MCLPCVVGAALDNDLARLQSRLTVFQYQRHVTLKQADDVDGVGLVHGRVARLIDHVMFATIFRKPRTYSFIESRLGNAFWRRSDNEPSHLHFAVRWSQHRAARTQIAIVASIERSRNSVLPDLEQPTEFRAADLGRRATIDDDDRLALGVVASDHATHRISE